MLMGLRQKIGRTHEQEKAGVQREQVPERVLRDRERRSHDRSDERGDRVHGEPLQRLPPVVALAEDEADRVHPIGEVVCHDGDEHEKAGGRVHSEREPDSQSVDEAVE